MFKMLRQSTPSQIRHFTDKVLSAMLLAATVGSVAAGPTLAAYEKTTYGGTNYAPGQQVTVQIKVTPPTSLTIVPVEAVFVVDTSNSIASNIGTFKTNLLNFANNLSSAYGHIKVGLVTFGYIANENDCRPQIAYPLEQYYGAGNRIIQVNGSSDVTNLDSAINSIQARPDISCFSDIQGGLKAGNDLFSSSATNGRYLALLTDGIDNQPASGSSDSYGGTYYAGVCVLDGSGKPTFTPKYTQLTLVDAATGQNVPYPSPDNSVPGMNTVYWPCQSYITNVYNTYITGTQLLKDMANRSGAYPNTLYSTNLNDPITRVKTSLQTKYIQVHDIVNTSIFASNPSGPSITNGAFYNCDTNTALANGTFTPNGRRFDAQILYDSNVTNYCFRFTATLQGGIAPGTYAIDNPNDTTSYAKPYNTAQYYNPYDDVISQDYISAGSINIVAYDLKVSEFNTANSNGAPTKVFTTSDSVYVHYKPQNNTPYTTPSGAVSQIFSNAPSMVAAGTTSDVGISVPHGAWSANAPYTYDSWPGGNYNTVYVGGNSWTKTVGDYTARAFVNYQEGSGPVLESDYSNNQSAATGYSVITPPSNFNVSNLKCTSAHLSWSAGSSNITGYKVTISPPDGATYPVSTGTNTYYDATGLKELTSYSWGVIATTKNGDSQVFNAPAGSLNTPSCPHFDVSSTTINATPFNSSSNPAVGQLTVSYTSPSGTWNTGDQINSTIVAFQSGSLNCSSYNPKGAAVGTTVSGVTSTFGNDTSSYVTSYNGSAIPLKVTVVPTATVGTYTACVGSWSPVSPDLKMSTITVKINMTPWFQVGGPTDTSTSAGDVFSNGGISFMPVPYSPIRKYFFVGNSQGVVISNSLVGILSDMQSTGADWRATNYPTAGATQKTLDYDALKTDAGRRSPLQPSTFTPGTFNSNCNKNGITALSINADPAIIGNDVTWDNKCEGTSLIFFIDGDLQVNANVIDTTKTGTLTFIVKGNITVNPSVTQMDGVYLFGKSFSDGASNRQLIVHGSLLGLSGQTPNANSGTFMASSNQTGLQRDLGPSGAGSNQDTPAELIYYQPKYLYVLGSSVLAGSTFSWVE